MIVSFFSIHLSSLAVGVFSFVICLAVRCCEGEVLSFFKKIIVHIIVLPSLPVVYLVYLSVFV